MAKKPDMQEIRRKNLAVVSEQWGGPSGLAKKLELSGPSYISQMLGGHRPITEKTARKYEAELDLPPGWLDEERSGRPQPAPVDDRLFRKVVALVDAMLNEEKVELSRVKFGDLVIMVYEEHQRRGTIDEDFIKRLIKLVR